MSTATTLLLRMRAPMMSWGSNSQFTVRTTRTEPTKSAVIGLLCSALGRPRSEPIDDLVALKMGVRVDREGKVLMDYHTISGAIKASGGKGDTVLSDRYYIADGDYIVGLEGDRSLLMEIDAALEHPKWQIFFGRKSFVPSRPIRIGIESSTLELSLISSSRTCDTPLRLVLETSASNDIRKDVPINWQERSLLGSRYVKTLYL